MEESVLEQAVKPFTKWVGGKRRIIKKILPFVPLQFDSYFEPFVGGGAMYFTIGCFAKQCYINDINGELINAYCQLRDNPQGLKERLRTYIYDKDFYLAVRARDRDPSFVTSAPLERAVRLIYLLRVCYNGLYRVNSQGYFNTPFGRYDDPKICRDELLDEASAYLNQVPTEISNVSYSELIDKMDDNSFVYFDPPYMPIARNSFTSYHAQDEWDDSAQAELARFCQQLDSKGVRFMQSNSDSSAIRKLYQGFTIIPLSTHSTINADPRTRHKRREVLIINYKPPVPLPPGTYRPR
ncbi:MAG: Dam family site-specific DNA-(adenine-N6)-methyltransferase [Candidatus Anaerobiospirillum merdipullorum]|uniref:site-specific DNA-methyltransferase (adenine-specific) n=1 Tax=Candidatus Anaerobiospirillum merdipullorum TaxID=2838450 RepID=A0A9E2KMH6_9GAMM|nr:Dam family site-specific DNA-(adenine-N6)-methyltransferase [Candidatus Anaerobiospirillum merdipullorum]